MEVMKLLCFFIVDMSTITTDSKILTNIVHMMVGLVVFCWVCGGRMVVGTAIVVDKVASFQLVVRVAGLRIRIRICGSSC